MTARVKKSKHRRSKSRSLRPKMLLRMDPSNPPFKENVTVKQRHLNEDLFEVTSWQSGMRSGQFQQSQKLRRVHEPARRT